MHADDDGSYVVRGRLDPEVGALLERVLDAAAKALYDERRSSATADGETPTAALRQADAIGLVVDLALQSPGLSAGRAEERSVGQLANSDDNHPVDEHPDDDSLAVPPMRSLGRAGRVQVVLHVEAETLREDGDAGQAVLDGGVRVSAETSRRLACDASTVTMTHDATGTVLDVGRRSRTVPSAIRRALEHRDRGCRFPGCGNRYVDAHHLQHWADGGATKLDNLVLLWRRHHRLVHEDGYRVGRLESGALIFTRPDGRVIPHAPSTAPGACECSSDHQLRTFTTAAGPAHARLDLGWAMQVLYRT